MTTTSRRSGSATAAMFLSAALVLTACGSDGGDADDKAGETHSVTADNGTIEVPVDPQRVVTIGNTTLPFIDMGGEPMGVTDVSASELGLIPEEQKATFEAATNLGASADQVDMEQLAGLEPDLILAQFPESEFEPLEKRLESIAPTVFWGLGTEWKAFADGLARAGDVTDELGEQKAEFESKVTGIQETYGEIIDDISFVNLDRWASSDPGTYSIADFGCVEIAQDDIGMDFPEAAEGQDPLGWTSLPFEQLAELSEYDVITYPVDAEGRPTEPFAPVVETNTWKALPAVSSGRALGVFCPGNNSYGPVLQYLDSLDAALATLPAKE
ncbi:ABC transporter substrate-binding protein [Nocardioides carbamazepini]|uniref:ABC transporter substrate-binding protein n=1 Tax=Nocardioides carbamazepini TaxID=2854259 RepID=UPI002149B7C2|nr:ABC transporter substrate-binding protein [Nocardioides carbamazepini]MCR1782565.1 ABC transporter substrate-binding protein [Nocardioides carbamazepini]